MIDSFLLTCIAISIIDRAGIPAAMISGLVWGMDQDVSLPLFVVLCAFSGFIGDAIMFMVGRWLSSESQTRNDLLKNSSLTERIKASAIFIERAPRMWLVFGRAFQLINQFIPLAAGIRGMRHMCVLPWCLLGNIMWFGGFAIAVWQFDVQLEKYSKPISIGGLVVGLSLVALSFHFMQKRKLGNRVASFKD